MPLKLAVQRLLECSGVFGGSWLLSASEADSVGEREFRELHGFTRIIFQLKDFN